MTQSPVIVRISEWDMRKMFNDDQYRERTQTGELSSEL